MNKKTICLVALVDLFCLAGFVSAVTIPNYGPASFCALLTGISNAVIGLVASIGTIMIIVAGILYLTSGGSPERMAAGKKAFVYAIVGLVIALAAKAIVSIVVQTINAGGGNC